MEKISYRELNARQKETYNFHKLSAALADYGFNSIKLSDDWNGADFIAVNMVKGTSIRVQLKSRLTVDKKYLNSDLYIAFPIKKFWYLVPHDTLVSLVKEHTKWTKTKSWNHECGGYSSGHPNKKLVQALEEYKL